MIFNSMISCCIADWFWPIVEKISYSQIYNVGWILSLTEWQPWRTWSRCSKTCGNGARSRTRSCTNGPGCIGLNEDKEVCNVTKCPGEKGNRNKYVYSFEYHILLNFNNSSRKTNSTIVLDSCILD